MKLDEQSKDRATSSMVSNKTPSRGWDGHKLIGAHAELDTLHTCSCVSVVPSFLLILWIYLGLPTLCYHAPSPIEIGLGLFHSLFVPALGHILGSKSQEPLLK